MVRLEGAECKLLTVSTFQPLLPADSVLCGNGLEVGGGLASGHTHFVKYMYLTGVTWNGVFVLYTRNVLCLQSKVDGCIEM